MNNLVSIVHNSVSRDTRVLKEALSVSEGLNTNYTIIGIADDFDNREEDWLNNKIKIVRIKKPRIRLTLQKHLIDFARSHFFLGVVSGLFFFPMLFVLKVLESIGFKKFVYVRKIYSLLFDLRLTISTQLHFVHYSYLFAPVLEQVQPGLIHAHDLPMLAVAIRYKKSHPAVKIIYDAHEIFEHMSNKGTIFQFFFGVYLKRRSKSVDAFITINESIKNFHLQKYPDLPEALVVKNATSRELLKKSQKKSNLIREKLGILNSKKILLYQGGYTPARGLDRIIKSVPRINTDWVLVFMGWGENESELKEEAQQLGLLNERVFFIPPAKLENLTEWTSGADVGIIPYLNTCLNHYFCTPNKLWEYPVARLPIVVPDYPELARAVTTYSIGWTMKDMDPASIASTINSIRDEDILSKVSNVESYFSFEAWENYNCNLLKAYEQVLGCKRVHL